MGQLTVRLFGGFEVRRNDGSVIDFDSDIVKALLAYLLTQRDQSFDRGRLAALLWPEEPDETARRNLRHAVHSLESALSGGEITTSPLLSSSGDLRIDPELDCWVDVEAFEHLQRQGISKETVDLHYLTSSAALYRGDFLSGFFVEGNLELAFWQLAQQERLRHLAVEALRALIESYLSRGEFGLGLRYLRRLVGIEPLSEEAHRYLMQLYAVSDQPGRALAQYHELRENLSKELGVEPVAETQKLYDTILHDMVPALPSEEEGKGMGPLVPMVGRQGSYRLLGKCWQAVLQNRCRLTFVEGEAGVGKNRLIKSFLDAASSRRAVTILKGQCDELVPTCYQPFAQVLHNALVEASPRASTVLETIPPDLLSVLALLMPGLRDLRPDLPDPEALSPPRDRERLFECIALILEGLCRPAATGSTTAPLVVMLGELQWSGEETADLLEYLLLRLADLPVWILCTSELGAAEGRPVPSRRLGHDDAPVLRIVLDRLEAETIDELAATLVGTDQAEELARFLIHRAGGLPLAVSEWINSMWDRDILVQQGGDWHLKDSLTGISGDLRELIQERLHRLPTSTRRLASQAAVIGQHFDAELLRKAASEHKKVVTLGLELMLDRWLIRQHSDHWRTGRREPDVVLLAKDPRGGSFEFTHHLIWRSILDDVNPLRRQVMHGEVAEALEEDLGERAERCSEVLARHFVEAGVWNRAIVYLRHAADRAQALFARDTARHYLRQAGQVLQRLAGAARTRDEEARWLRERSQILDVLDEIEQSRPSHPTDQVSI